MTTVTNKINIYHCGGTGHVLVGGPVGGPLLSVPLGPFWLQTGINTDYFNLTYIHGYPSAAYPMNNSVEAGVRKVISAINRRPGKFILSGQSQGAQVVTTAYQRLVATNSPRLADLVMIISAGNPIRQAGRAYPGAKAVPSGHGLAPASMRLTNTPDLIWEFANDGDFVCTNGDDANGLNRTTLYQFIYQNFTGTFAQLMAAVNTQLQPLLTNLFTYHSSWLMNKDWVPAGETSSWSQIILNHLNTVVGPQHATTYDYAPRAANTVSTRNQIARWNDGVNRHTLYTACGTQQDGWGIYNDPGTTQGRAGLLALVNGILSALNLPTVTSLPADGTFVQVPPGLSPDTAVGRLVDKNLYNWVPVSYPASFPGAPANLDNGWQPSNISFADSVKAGTNQLISLIRQTPGTFALCGMSQGSMVISNVLRALQPGGVLADRGANGDCIAGVAFGNPSRKLNTGFPGGIAAPGAGLFSLPNANAALTGLSNTVIPDWWWEMTLPGDAVGDLPMNLVNGQVGVAINRVASAICTNKGSSMNLLSSVFSMGTTILTVAASVLTTLFQANSAAVLREIGIWLRDLGVLAGFSNTAIVNGVLRSLLGTDSLEGDYPEGNPHMLYGVVGPSVMPSRFGLPSSANHIDLAVAYLNARAGAVAPRASRVRAS